MKIVITGGAGFIGSYLSERLLKLGHHVVVLDNLSGTHQDLFFSLIPNHPNLRFVKGSVCDEDLVANLLEDCQWVIHLAAYVGVKNVLEYPIELLEEDTLGIQNILRQACKQNCSAMVASSSEVYGENPHPTFKENHGLHLDCPADLRWSYACVKAYSEFLSLAYWRKKQLPIVVLRFFNVTGPGQSRASGMVMPSLLRAALSGEALRIYGTGEQKRCFTHVEEVVECLVRLMGNPKALGKIINVGSQQEISILQLAHKILSLTKSPSNIEFQSYQDSYGTHFKDISRRLPDLKYLKELTGLIPQKSIDEMLEEMISFSKEVKKNNDFENPLIHANISVSP